jgi:hypothetical protein
VALSGQRRGRNLINMSTTSDEKNLVEENNKGDEYLQSLEELIPIYRGLDKSFWDQGPFLRWQLVRLNDQYRKDVDALWTAFRSWLNNWPNRDEEDLGEIESIQKDYPPTPGQTTLEWLEEFVFGKYYDDSDIYRREPVYHLSMDFRDIEPTVYWDSPLLRAQVDPDEDAVSAEMQSGEGSKKICIDPTAIRCLYPAPIPWQIHFPHTFFLDKLPPWPEKKARRGRPQDWALNLLVYDLSRAGAKDMEIDRLLFDLKKSTETYLSEHQVLVRIATIKKTVYEAVSNAYPILHSLYT